MQVSDHAKIRIRERVTNVGSEKPSSLFKKVMTYGKNITDFYGDYRDYLNNIYIKNGGKVKLKIYGSNIYVYSSSLTKNILITVLNTPVEFEPWKDYLRINRNDVEVIKRLQNKKLNESEVISMDKVSRKEMLKWDNKKIEEWKTRAYTDRENTYLECKHCNRFLPCTEFSKDNNITNRLGFRPECKECGKAIKEYGGVKKMKDDNITIFDILHIHAETVPVVPINTEETEEHKPIRIKREDTGLGDKIIRCRDCDNDFVFNRGEQIYYRNHGYLDPSRCPNCREKAKQEKAREEVETPVVVPTPTEAGKSNLSVITDQAKRLLEMLKDSKMTLETFESILEVYKDSNEYALELVRSFEGLIISEKDLCNCCDKTSE